MKIFERSLLGIIERVNRADLTFGFASALVVSVLGVLIASAAAYYYTR